MSEKNLYPENKSYLVDLSTVREAGKTLWYRFKGECVFCSKIENEAQDLVYESSEVVAFPPLKNGILAEGHLLVVPKVHYESIFEIPEDELSNLMSKVKEISLKLENEGVIEGVNILHASGRSAQQSISHIHFHLVPRKDDDNDLWPETGYVEKHYGKVYSRMRDLLD